MDFVAYNENKCSQQSVLDFIIYLILREKEPQIVEVFTYWAGDIVKDTIFILSLN